EVEEEQDKAETPSETTETEEILTEKSVPIDGEQPAQNVGSRYLEGAQPLTEKRRPADLFFGDDPSPQKTATRKKNSRASMPNPLLGRPSAPQEPEELVEDEKLYRQIPVDDIRPNPRQPR